MATEKRIKLSGKNRVLDWLWRVVSWIIFSTVYLVSWLAFVDTLFHNVKFTLYFMECEIGNMPPEEARRYLLDQQQEHTRQ